MSNKKVKSKNDAASGVAFVLQGKNSSDWMY